MKPNIQCARELRKKPTDTERFLWRHLRLRQIAGYKFRRQRPIGPYIVDFVCVEKKLIVEVDGGHHDPNQAMDARRDKWLRSQGYKIPRFWNNEVLTEVDGVQQIIFNALTQPPHLHPPPKTGEEKFDRQTRVDGGDDFFGAFNANIHF